VPASSATLPQSPAPTGDGLSEALASIGWFDWSAIAVVAVFLVIGLWKGFAWQLGRLAILVLAYAVPVLFGRSAGEAISGLFPADSDPELPVHVASAVLFIGVLTLVSVVVWVLRRVVEHSPLSMGNRVAGAVTGGVFGALLVLAMLTFSHMFGADGGLARAAERSESARVSRQALEIVETLLPADMAERAHRWRELLRDPELGPAEGAEPGAGPAEADFRRLDPHAPADAGGRR
jgi:membrane protein required for colicin V production